MLATASTAPCALLGWTTTGESIVGDSPFPPHIFTFSFYRSPRPLLPSPWMGQCIGRRNMRWFIAFNVCWVAFLTELLLTVFWH